MIRKNDTSGARLDCVNCARSGGKVALGSISYDPCYTFIFKPSYLSADVNGGLPVMDLSSAGYDEQRERKERDLAEAAKSPEIDSIHRSMAARYSALVLEFSGLPLERQL